MKKTSLTILISLILIISTATNGYAQSKKIEISKTIPLKKTKVCKAEISFPFGEIGIDTKSKHLLSADFEIEKATWRPQVEVDNGEEKVHIEISTPNGKKLKNQKEEDQSEWDISLNKEVRYDLDIKMFAGEASIDLSNSHVESMDLRMGAGEIDVNLSNSTITNFEFTMGAGEASINFSGLKDKDFEGEIKGAVGEVSILLPKEIGVKVKVTGLLGEVSNSQLTKEGSTYTSDNYGKTDHVFTLDIIGVIGEVNLKVE